MNCPQAYLEVLRKAQELGADIGDRVILLEKNAGSGITPPDPVKQDTHFSKKVVK